MLAGLPHAAVAGLLLFCVGCSRLSMDGKHSCTSDADCHGGRLCSEDHVCEEPPVPAEVPCGPDLPACGATSHCCGGRCVDYTPARWPEPAEGTQGSTPADPDAVAVFAVSELRLGVEGTEWQSVGFDLDCRATTLSGAEGSCENGNTAAEDGLDGRDSGFGQYLGPTLSSLTGPTAAPTSTTNQAILGGEATLLVELGGYSSDNPDDADVSVRLSPSPGRSGEAWLRLDSEAVSGRVFEFDEAYVVHHVVVARAAALDFMMRLKWSKGSDRVVSWIDTTLHQVVLTLDLRKYAKDSSVSVSGMLGAVWRPRELKLALAGILYDVGICPQTLDSGDEVILDRVDEALDIRIVPDVSARPAGRPMLEPCQAVSFGLGFKASLDETTDEPIPASKPLFSSSCLCSNEPGAQAAVPPDRCWDVFAKSRLLGTAGAGP